MRKQHHYASGKHEDELIFGGRTPNAGALIGACHLQHSPDIYKEVRDYEERHQNTIERDAKLKYIRENEDVVRRVLAILEQKRFKNMSALNPRNYALVSEIASKL